MTSPNDIFSQIKIEPDSDAKEFVEYLRSLEHTIAHDCPHQLKHVTGFMSNGTPKTAGYITFTKNVYQDGRVAIKFNTRAEEWFFHSISKYYHEYLLISQKYFLVNLGSYFGGIFSELTGCDYYRAFLPVGIEYAEDTAKMIKFLSVNADCKNMIGYYLKFGCNRWHYPNTMTKNIDKWECIEYLNKVSEELKKLGHPELCDDPLIMEMSIDPKYNRSGRLSIRQALMVI